MIYRVVDGSTDIYGDLQGTVLLDPSLKLELNAAGSFSFKVPPVHDYYGKIKALTDTINVYEDDDLIFTGRPTEIKNDWFNQEEVYCEGALAYFNDSIQRPKEYSVVNLTTFFKDLITNHNSQVSSSRQFTVGNITITDKQVYRKLNWETTFECLKKMCLEAEGGYLFIRTVNGVNYVDWLEDMPYQTSQPVSFALNLLDLSQDTNMSNFYTAVIPIGKTKDADGNEEELLVTAVNGGKDYIDSDAVNTYGRITAVQRFDDISDASKLLEAGKEWLSKNQWDRLCITANAAELHYLSDYSEYSAFKVGQKVHVSSTPHLIDKDFPLTKIEIKLDSPKKTVTLGTPEHKDLTEIYAEKTY